MKAPEDRQAPTWFSGAVLVLALGGATILPGHRLGAGVVLVASILAALVIATRPRPLEPQTVVLTACAGVLVSTALVRATPWLVVLNLVAAVQLASLALAGVDSWRGIARGTSAAPSRLPAAPSFIAAPLIARLAAHDAETLSGLLRGIGLATVVVGLFGALFASADRAFAHLATQAFPPRFDVALLPVRIATFGAIALGAGALVLTAPRFRAHPTDAVFGQEAPGDFWSTRPTSRRLSTFEWAIPLALLDVLFAIFVVLQLTVLFGGHEHVLHTAGLTYSEYARHGFFQLLIVAALVLVVLATVANVAELSERRHALLARGLGVALCALTLVVLASAVRRLTLYEQAYGFTEARLGGHAIALWLAGIFVALIVAAAIARSAWLPVTLVGYTALALVVFNAINPQALIARANIDRFERTGKIDVAYLSTLDADAVPTLLELPQPLSACALAPIRAELARDDGWSAWNAARARARALLTTRGFGECE